MPLTLGLLGGMGPAATLDFLAKLQAATPARQDAHHIRVIADINPQLPDPHASGSGAGPALAEMAGALRGAGADVLAIASNGAHVHADLIQRASGLPLIDMIATAAGAARRTGVRRVGVLGARQAARLYHEHIAAGAMGMITLEPERLAAYLEAIAEIRDGDRSEAMGDRLAGFAADLMEAGAQVVILAGMDTALLMRREAIKVQLIDPAEHLARRCAAVCLGAEPLPQRPAGSWSSAI
jgi:aspartate racemase